MHEHSTQPYILSLKNPLNLKALKAYLGMVSLPYLILTAMTLEIPCSPNNLFKTYVWDLRFIYICKRYYILLQFLSQMAGIYSKNLFRGQEWLLPIW